MRDPDKIKVLHLISSSGLLGAEQVLLELASQSRLADLDVTIGVFENSQNPNLELANSARERGFDVRTFPCKGRFDKKTTNMINTYLNTNAVNILHSHNYKSNFYASRALPDDGCQWVVTNHGRRIGPALLIYNALDRFIVRRADKVVAVSEKIAQELSVSGVKDERLSVIDNGISIERFSEVKPTVSLKASLGIGPDAQVSGTIGSLTNEKGHEYLLNAIPAVLKIFPATVFILVGEGSERSRLENLSRRLGIQKNVLFTGMRRDIPEILSILDVFVFPSLKEGLPMALLEAQAARVPTIASAVGAIPKVIKDGFTGTLVQPGDSQSLASAVVRALSEKRRVLEMAQRGFERVRDNFSAAKMTEKYITLYNEALLEKRQGKRQKV